MGILDDPAINTWTFINIDFAVIASDSQIWFQEDTIMTNEPILGGGVPFIDVASAQRPDMSRRCVFESDGISTANQKRDQFLTKRSSSGTLSNGRGRSCKAYLKSVTPIPGDNNFSYVDAVFVFMQ